MSLRSLFTVAVLLLSRAGAAQPSGALAEGNAAYQKGDYAAAAAAYQKLVDSGVASADVYFNLGTAQLKSGQRGAAILSYERALRMDPGDADAAFNLAEAQKGNIDKIVGASEEAPLLERLGSQIPVNTAGLVFLTAWLFGNIALLLRWFRRGPASLLAWVGWTGVLIALVAAPLFALGAWNRASSPYAIVVSATAPVREGPASDFKAAFEVHEGLKVRVVRRENGFLRIHLLNGTEGWVADRDAPII
jgi:tetratricopeptide (TPR) repeat protein